MDEGKPLDDFRPEYDFKGGVRVFREAALTKPLSDVLTEIDRKLTWLAIHAQALDSFGETEKADDVRKLKRHIERAIRQFTHQTERRIEDEPRPSTPTEPDST